MSFDADQTRQFAFGANIRRVTEAIDDYNKKLLSRDEALVIITPIIRAEKQEEEDAKKKLKEAMAEARKLEEIFKKQEGHRIKLEKLLPPAMLLATNYTRDTSIISGGRKLYHRKRKSSRKKKSRRNIKSTQRKKRHSRKKHSKRRHSKKK